MRSRLDIDWTPLPGGRYAGKTLPQLLFGDPDYFFHQYGPDPRSFSEVRWQADLIAQRAKHIGIPSIDGKKRVAEYLLDPSDRQRFGGVVLIPETEHLPSGFHSKGRKDVFDLSFPHVIAPYDRHAGKRLIEQVKELVLGDRSARMNKARCEQFFNDQSRFTQFALPPGPTW